MLDRRVGAEVPFDELDALGEGPCDSTSSRSSAGRLTMSGEAVMLRRYLVTLVEPAGLRGS